LLVIVFLISCICVFVTSIVNLYSASQKEINKDYVVCKVQSSTYTNVIIEEFHFSDTLHFPFFGLYGYRSD